MNTVPVGTKLNDWGKQQQQREKGTCWASTVHHCDIIKTHIQCTEWIGKELIKRKCRTAPPPPANTIKQCLSSLPTVIMATLITLHSGRWFHVTLLLKWAHIHCNHSQPGPFSRSLIHSVSCSLHWFLTWAYLDLPVCLNILKQSWTTIFSHKGPSWNNYPLFKHKISHLANLQDFRLDYFFVFLPPQFKVVMCVYYVNNCQILIILYILIFTFRQSVLKVWHQKQSKYAK